MPLPTTLDNVLRVPTIWISLHALEHPEADERNVTFRVQVPGKRSVSCKIAVSPEESILKACAEVANHLERWQEPLTPGLLKAWMALAINHWVEPF
jgi:hypothetical protein